MTDLSLWATEEARKFIEICMDNVRVQPGFSYHPVYIQNAAVDLIATALTSAILKERERCELIALRERDRDINDFGGDLWDACDTIAADIRLPAPPRTEGK